MRKILFLFVALLLAAGCAQVEEQTPITNFEECAAAANPVMEDFPGVRICTANGQNFTQQIDEPDMMPPGWDEPGVNGDVPSDSLPDLYPGICYERDGTPVKLSEGCAEGEEVIANVMGFKVPYVCCTVNGELQKNYCTPESKQAEFCIQVYDPVCGWFVNGQGTDTYYNSCVACMDDKVEYWIQSEC